MDRYTERLVQGHPGPEAKLTLAAGILLCLGAVGVAVYGIISGSIAIILDAVNNISDAASSLITIIGTKLAGKEPDREIKVNGPKLHEYIREMSRDYTVRGDKLWEQFNQKRKALHQWYYSSIYRILADEFGDVPLIPTPTV